MPLTGLVEKIYEAGSSPDLWPELLHELAEKAGAEGGAILAYTASGSRYLTSAAIADDYQEFWTSEWATRNSRLKLVAIDEPRFLTEFDAFTEAELDADPMYVEFLRPRGLGWCVGTTIRIPGFQEVAMTFERRLKNGPVEPRQVAVLDALRPHIARAAMFSARLGLATIHSSVMALAALGLPAAALDGQGRMIDTNEQFDAMRSGPLLLSGNRVRFSNAAAQSILDQVLNAPADTGSGRITQSFPVAEASGAAQHIFHLMPVRGVGHDLFTGASWILFATPVGKTIAPKPDLLQGLFDLTPAEAKVASQIAGGLAIRDISVANTVSQDTVRMHLKSIFSKTGTHRQAELVSLLSIPTYQ